MIRITYVTITYQAAKVLQRTLDSVLEQDYPEITHLMIDGASTDGTLEMVNDYIERSNAADNGHKVLLMSEPDNGIYDAMNKGIQMATGDVVGILNSDDYFTSSDVIERMVKTFDDPKIDAVYGDIHFIHDGKPDKCVRYYSSKPFRPLCLRFGFMPAHPSFYCRREVFEKVGLYKTDYKIGSDYEMMVRLFMIHKIRAKYLPIDFVTMRTGGTSTRDVKSRLQLIKDDVRGCRENGIYTNPLMISMKYLYKIFEFRR